MGSGSGRSSGIPIRHRPFGVPRDHRLLSRQNLLDGPLVYRLLVLEGRNKIQESKSLTIHPTDLPIAAPGVHEIVGGHCQAIYARVGEDTDLHKGLQIVAVPSLHTSVEPGGI